jgi:hypothetical protein
VAAGAGRRGEPDLSVLRRGLLRRRRCGGLGAGPSGRAASARGRRPLPGARAGHPADRAGARAASGGGGGPGQQQPRRGPARGRPGLPGVADRPQPLRRAADQRQRGQLPGRGALALRGPLLARLRPARAALAVAQRSPHPVRRPPGPRSVRVRAPGDEHERAGERRHVEHARARGARRVHRLARAGGRGASPHDRVFGRGQPLQLRWGAAGRAHDDQQRRAPMDARLGEQRGGADRRRQRDRLHLR